MKISKQKREPGPAEQEINFDRSDAPLCDAKGRIFSANTATLKSANIFRNVKLEVISGVTYKVFS
jgi:hypothetical protein